MDEHDMEAVRLQEELKQRHAELAAVAAGTPARGALQDAVLVLTDALLAYDDEIPDLREQQRRRASSVVTAGAAGLAAAVMLVLGVLAWRGDISRWYFLPIGLTALVAVLVAGLEYRADWRGHRGRMAAGLLTFAAAVLVMLVVTKVLSAFLLILWLLGLVVTFGVWVEHLNFDKDGGAS